MNIHNTFLLTACLASTLLAGCSTEDENNPLLNPGNLSQNSGTISQSNFSVLASDFEPTVFDPMTGAFTKTDLTITVFIGDRNNRALTDSHVVNFRSEYGLIENSCTTVSGTCGVTWSAISSGNAPNPRVATIIAYTSGEESFNDTNGNSLFDNADSPVSFTDIVEPFVDYNENGSYDAGELIIDTVNASDATGADGTHNVNDNLFNGGGCTHSTLCSTTFPYTTVWDSIAIKLDGPVVPPTTYTVGGTVTGTTITAGNLVLQNNGGDDVTLNSTTPTTFTFATALLDTAAYAVTILTNTTGLDCTTVPISGGSAGDGSGIIAAANVTNIALTCT